MYSTDPGATAARFAELQSYFAREVLREKAVVCASIDACRRSALLDGAGRRRPDVAFAAGQLPHLGRHYDLAEDGRPVRVMLVGMETGRPDAGVDLDRRRAQLAASVATAMTGRNPHMQGVTHALRLVHGRPVGTDRAGELIDLGPTAVHLFDTMALTNVRLCSA